jgi:hypothetical protein
MTSSDRTKYVCSSAMSLPFDVNIGIVVDGVLDASILREKYARLIELSPLLGGKLLSKVQIIQELRKRY